MCYPRPVDAGSEQRQLRPADRVSCSRCNGVARIQPVLANATGLVCHHVDRGTHDWRVPVFDGFVDRRRYDRQCCPVGRRGYASSLDRVAATTARLHAIGNERRSVSSAHRDSLRTLSILREYVRRHGSRLSVPSCASRYHVALGRD